LNIMQLSKDITNFNTGRGGSTMFNKYLVSVSKKKWQFLEILRMKCYLS